MPLIDSTIPDQNVWVDNASLIALLEIATTYYSKK